VSRSPGQTSDDARTSTITFKRDRGDAHELEQSAASRAGSKRRDDRAWVVVTVSAAASMAWRSRLGQPALPARGVSRSVGSLAIAGQATMRPARSAMSGAGRLTTSGVWRMRVSALVYQTIDGDSRETSTLRAR